MRDFYHDIAGALEYIEVEEHGFGSVLGYLKMARDTAGPHGARLMFIGNGGSAAIASHMANDFQKNGGIPSMCFNDLASLTCISNDYGYENVFLSPMRKHARLGDVLFAISSSGESDNIVEAARWGGTTAHLNIVTLSGFNPKNRLRSMGGVNFYVPSKDYGVVETVHLGILHAILHEANNDH